MSTIRTGGGNCGRFVGKLAVVDRVEEFAEFDALPFDVREAIRQHPEDVVVAGLRRLVADYGGAAVAMVVREAGLIGSREFVEAEFGADAVPLILGTT